MTRLSAIPEEQMTPEQREEWASLTKWRPIGPDGQVGGPFDTWMRNPEMSRQLRRFGVWVWERTSLDRGIVEFAISVISRHWDSNVEWTSHAPRAVEYGIPQSVMDDLRADRAPETDRSDIVLAFEVCRGLLEGHALSQGLYDRAVAEFGERGLVELCATVGYYTTVAFTLRAFEVEPAEGVERPFERPSEV